MLGSSITRELLDSGFEVRAMIFPGSPAGTLKGLDIEVISGNLLNLQDTEKAVAGCDAIIHCAGDTNTWPARSARTRAVNVDGTANMIRAALNSNISRFIYTGSASSFGFGTREKPGTEASPYVGFKYGLDNVDSKYEGLKLVLNAWQQHQLQAVAIAPTFMFGPYDTKPGSGRMILSAKQRKVPAICKGGKNFVYSRDVAIAHVNALSKGRPGECYIAGNVNLSYSEILPVIAEIVHSRPPKFHIPNSLMKATGLISSLMGRLFDFEPTLTAEMAIVACDSQFFDCSKAVRELEMPQTDIREAISAAYDWFRQNGYCD